MDRTKEIDILDLLIILAKHKKFIIWTTIIVSIAAVIFSLVTPKYWVSTATILPASDVSNSSILDSSLLGLGSSILGSGIQNDAISLIAIMKSRTFSENVVRNFDLIDYYEIDDPDSLIMMELAVIKLKEKTMNISFNDETGFIHINAETRNKQLSAKLANYYVKQIENYNQNIRVTKGKQKRKFLESRIEEIENNIEKLSLQMNIFQKKYNAINLPEQTKSILTVYSDLLSEKKMNEIELELLKFSADVNSPKIDILKKKNELLEKKIKDIESKENNSYGKYGLELDSISDLMLKYAELEMQINVEKDVYQFLYPRYEQARLEELKDLPTIEVIDRAVPAGLRSKPRRALICILSFFIALITSSLMSIFLEFLNSEKIRFQELKTILKK